MPKFKCKRNTNPVVDSANKRRESKRIVNTAVKTLIQTENLTELQRRLLIRSIPALRTLINKNIEKAFLLEDHEIANSLFKYIEYLQSQIIQNRKETTFIKKRYAHLTHFKTKDSHYRQRGQTRQKHVSISRISAKSKLPCCSEYPGIYPFCDKTC